MLLQFFLECVFPLHGFVPCFLFSAELQASRKEESSLHALAHFVQICTADSGNCELVDRTPNRILFEAPKSFVCKIEILVFYLQFRASFSVDKLPLALFDKLQRAHRSVAIAVYLDRLFQVSLARRFAFVPGNVLSISHDVARSVLCWIACRCCWRLRVAWSLRSRAAVLNESPLRNKCDSILTF